MQVAVTCHEASTPPSCPYADCVQQWRVLRFNETRQSVSRVAAVHSADGGRRLMAVPNCLAFEYLKTEASLGEAGMMQSNMSRFWTSLTCLKDC